MAAQLTSALNEPAATPTEEPQGRAADWAKLKAAAKEWQGKASDYEKRLLEREQTLAELKARNQGLGDPAALREREQQLAEDSAHRAKQLAAVQQRLAEAHVSLDPRFVERFDAPIASAKAEVQKLTSADEYLGDDERELIGELLEAKPSQWRTNKLKEVIDFADMDNGAKIYGAIKAHDEKVRLRAEELATNAERASKHILAQSAPSVADVTHQLVNDAARRNAKRPSMQGEAYPQTMAFAEKFMTGGLPPDVVADIPFKLRDAELAEKKIRELEDQLEQTRRPGTNGNGNGNGHHAHEGPLPHESGGIFIDAFRRASGNTRNSAE